MLQHKLHFYDLLGWRVLHQSQYPILCKYGHNFQWYNWNRSTLFIHTTRTSWSSCGACLPQLFKSKWWG